MVAEKNAWLSAHQAGAILGISLDTVRGVAERAGIRRKELPGLHPRYCREDVDRLAVECIKVGPDPESSGDQGNQKKRGIGSAAKQAPTPRPDRQPA